MKDTALTLTRRQFLGSGVGLGAFLLPGTGRTEAVPLYSGNRGSRLPSRGIGIRVVFMTMASDE